MKCTQCKKIIHDTTKMQMVNADGDFVCSEECAKKYKKERDEFFSNLHNDNWYHNYMT